MTSLPANGLYVLAQVISRSGLYGLQPLERLKTDANGTLLSLEPAAGARLPGVVGAGQYVIVKVTAPQGLIQGIARNAAGQPAAGLPVRLNGKPWLTFSDTDGAFRLVAPAGEATLVVTDPVSGNTGQSAVAITDPNAVVDATLGLTSSGLRIASVTPTNGAVSVSRVTSVVLQFNKPVNPATLVGGGVQLFGADGQPVPATFSLNLKNTTATLLPTAQLAANTTFTIAASTNITDQAGARLEGLSTFSFTTETDVLARNPNAQLISYEPVNGFSGVLGMPGIAEPNSPVIIVNETSGRTATVLSKADGSFTNSIEAEVDDMISAVLVNKNGSRNTVSLSRQIFRDGSVGLFNAGGTIEAQTPEGPIQLEIEPGAISGKNKFKLESLTLAQIQNASSNTPPEGGSLVFGGFKVAMEGQSLKVGAHVSFPVKESDLNLAPGDSPSNHVFAMCEPLEVDGVNVYRILDSMSYEGGRVVSHSPPFDGLDAIPGGGLAVAMVMYPFNVAQKMAVVGSVVVATESMYDPVRTNGAATYINANHPGVHLLPHAWVNAYPQSGTFETHKGLTPGTFVAKANSAGFFAYLLPFNPFQGSGYILAAQSSLFADQIATRAVYAGPMAPVATADLIFRVPDNGSGRADTSPPLITANPPGNVLPVNETNTIDFLIRDNLGAPRFDRIDLVRNKSFSLVETNLPVNPLDPAKVVLMQNNFPQNLGPTSIKVPIEFLVKEPAMVTVKVRAADPDLNDTETEFTFYFGVAPPVTPSRVASADPNDRTPPQVAWTLPPQDAWLEGNSPIVVSFSKAVNPSITNGLATTLSPSAPVHVELSEDQLVASIFPVGLKAGTNYTLTIGSLVKDLNGNSLDQDPTTTAADPFKLSFKTAPGPISVLPSLGRPAGTLVHQNRAFTIDAFIPGTGPAIVVHQLGNPISVITNIALPSVPRALTIIPEYHFARNYVAPAESKPLLVVVGGTIGTGGDGQWIRLYDISKTNAVERIGSAILTTDLGSSAANVKFSSPNLFVHMYGPDGSYIQVINLQALILGCNLAYDPYATNNPSDPNKWPTNALPYQMIAGEDKNNDGDYVDADEKLPIP
ncbi:MAG TPA: Ig-like domain-containing protein, partial [Clostridia bacterium]|nr:Ig-like domain-containing protein [Clostridia bacterium]